MHMYVTHLFQMGQLHIRLPPHWQHTLLFLGSEVISVQLLLLAHHQLKRIADLNDPTLLSAQQGTVHWTQGKSESDKVNKSRSVA